MKIGLLAANLFFASALVSAAGAATVTMSPPAAQKKLPERMQAQPKVLPAPVKPVPPAQTQTAAKKDCPCDCPKERKARNASARDPHKRRAVRERYYRYASAAPWRGPRRAAPMGYGPPPGVYEMQGLRIDDGGWTGGVGYGADGGGGGGGYGQAYFANGGGIENGPTYNSYGQSFQYNPSQAGPFQPRLMGGFAPQSTGSR